MNWAAFFGTFGVITGLFVYVFGLFALASLAESAGHDGSRWERPLWLALACAFVVPFAVVVGLTS